MRPTQAIEIFGNVSTPFGTLAISYLLVKILGDHPRGTPPILDLLKAISRKRCKLQLTTKRKSHMSFRLVTSNDLERRNSFNGCVISPNSVDFEADYVKVIEITPIFSAAEM